MAQVHWSDLPIDILRIILKKLKDPCETHEIFLPEGDTCLISSSSFGWLLTIRFNQPDEVHLLNPFTRDRIQLPSVREFMSQEDLRVITSSSPLNDHPTCLLLDRYRPKDSLAFCRPDDKYWKYFQDFGGSLEDAVLYKGEFYAVNYLGHIFHLDCNIPAARKVLGQLPIEFLECYHHMYLVELDGNLLLVVRYPHSRFEVYEFNWVEKVWTKVKNIGNNAILLGEGSSISLPINHLRNFKANCIYFVFHLYPIFFLPIGTKDNTDNIDNIGFYNMTTGQIENLYRSSTTWIWSSPLNWFAVLPPSLVIYKQNRTKFICKWKKTEQGRGHTQNLFVAIQKKFRKLFSCNW